MRATPANNSRRILSPVGENRIELVSAFRAGTVPLPRLEPERLRFFLGTSLADLKIPYHVTEDAVRIFTWAGTQLLALLLQRHRAALPAGEYDRLLLDDRFAALPELTDTLSGAAGNPDIRAAAELAPRTHPALTGGVMTAWLGPGGGGRSMVALIIETLRAAVTEMARVKGKEETPVLASLMLFSLYPHVERGIAAVPLSPPYDRSLRAAATCGVYLGWRIGLDRILREAQLPAELAMRMEAPLNPSSMLGGRAGVVASGATLLGVELQAGLPFFDDALARLNGGASAEAVQQQLASALGGEREVARRVEAAAAHSLLRERFIAAATLGEQGYLEPELAAALRELAIYPHRVQPLLDDDRARKVFWKDLKARADKGPRPVAEGLEPLVEALRGHNPKSPAAALGMKAEEAARVYARAAVALLCDHWMDRALGPWRRALDRRSGAEAEGGNEAEYAAGRLYRVSARPGPLLRQAVVSHVGHLFADVKDFTRRTSLLGQAVMGDLLRREFYLPVLESAKRHYAGLAFLPDGGGIQVNNLLGDAISLSGTITGLVSLASDLRRHLLAYERRLSREISGETISRSLSALEEDFAARLALCRPGSEAEQQLLAAREAALARARGEGLEAGIFISYGPAPIVVTMQDELFGPSRVAIADKINESARGTARNGGAKMTADAALAAERARRRDDALSHPWSVFVGAPLAVHIPAQTEQRVRAALASRDMVGARHALEGLVALALEDALRDEAEASPGDIYNNGVALSEEALFAFQQELGDKRVFRGVEVAPESLHEAIRRRFFFPPRPLRLIVGYTPDGRVCELFRYCGRVMFKGFERKGGIAVWEMISDGAAGKMIADYHAAAWFRLQAPGRAAS